ncbi:MAG: ABC transporter permease [Pirellulales bacterium]|nr:ABC transporter permease [Pirellulales bacterium]
MSFFHLILASLRHHWRMNLAVSCGTAVGTAVLTGALLVGDSMRGSLRTLVLDRLGRIDDALVANRFFRADLAPGTAPVILLRANLENPESEPPWRANRVNVIGSDDRFWKLGDLRPAVLPSAREITLNQPLAEQLHVQPGDAVVLRLPRSGAIPAESALGRKRDTVRSFRLTVKEILPARGLGGFSLRPNQQAPLNAYVPLTWLAERLGQPGRANALLWASPEGNREPPPLRPQLADYGLQCEKSPRGYFQITSSRMILPPREEKALLAALSPLPLGEGQGVRAESSIKGPHPNPLPKGEGTNYSVQPTLTYLANTLADGDRTIPYSTITAMDFTAAPPLGPFLDPAGNPVPPLKDNEIALNSWAAEDLHARVGDTIQVKYFEPESIHGAVREATAEFRLAAIIELAGAAADRCLTPNVRGVTDVKTMADWDPPFPFDATRIRPKDEEYWKRYGPTPKAFVSLATGRRLWGSRFGRTTALRLVSDDAGNPRRPQAAGLNNLDLRDFGFVWQPVRQQGHRAARGTTPFEWLFLGFSFFLIVAALMLVLLLFRLGVEQRAGQFGLLLAVGWRPRQVRRLLLAEAAVIALGGCLLGMLTGVGYAALMLWGLQTWWLPAISTPFLQLHVTPVSLIGGFTASLLAAFAALYLSARRIGRLPPRQLFAGGQTFLSGSKKTGKNACPPCLEILWLLVLIAHLPAWWLLRGHSEWEAGAFFGSGMLVLVLTLLVIRQRLRRGAIGAAVKAGRGNILRLAVRNAARTPGRSTLTVGLTAAACFLIAAISVFRIDPRQQIIAKASGNGGFALVAESDLPLYQNLNTPEGRSALGFTVAEEKQLHRCRFYALRVQPGDDASCLNLYRPARPRILGIPAALRDRGGFAWADVPAGCQNPWQLLNVGQVDNLSYDPLPVILEKNTANYSLHLWGGLGERWDLPGSRHTPYVVVALLSNSLFQGDLLLAEENLLRLFPEVAGYRFFLIETPVGQVGNLSHIREILESRLGDYGFSAETTGRRLARFLAVQNTYLSTFQSLGGLGLLLGVVGLAVVQMRNVLERRGELALLRATGLRRRTLAALVLCESAVLLALGLGAGLLAALCAILPQLANRQALIPWATLTGIVGLIFLAGLLTTALAVRRAVKIPLLKTLRKEG